MQLVKVYISTEKKPGCYIFNLPHRRLSFYWEFLQTQLVKPPCETTEKLAIAKRCSMMLKQASEMQVKSRTKVPLGWPFDGWQICEVSVTKKETHKGRFGAETKRQFAFHEDLGSVAEVMLKAPIPLSSRNAWLLIVVSSSLSRKVQIYQVIKKVK